MSSKPTFVQKLWKEILHLLPITVYFLIANELLAFTYSLTLKEYGINVQAFLTAVIVAGVIAKVVVIVDMLPFMNIFRHRPAIWNAAYASALYMLGALAVQFLEMLVREWIASGSFTGAIQEIENHTHWSRFWLKQVWIFVLLFNFCLIREIGEILAGGKLFDVIFRDRKAATLQSQHSDAP